MSTLAMNDLDLSLIGLLLCHWTISCTLIILSRSLHCTETIINLYFISILMITTLVIFLPRSVSSLSLAPTATRRNPSALARYCLRWTSKMFDEMRLWGLAWDILGKYWMGCACKVSKPLLNVLQILKISQKRKKTNYKLGPFLPLVSQRTTNPLIIQVAF